VKSNGMINTFGTIWKSKIAVRMIPLSILVVAIPLAVTVLVVGHVGQQQIIATARIMERSNVTSVEDAGQRFQSLGQAALEQSSRKIADICLSASKAASIQSEKDQAASLARSHRDFAEVTHRGFDDVTHQSLSASKHILSGVGNEIGTLLANSAQYTQSRVGDRVQSAILTQINAQMSERANQIADSFDSYITNNVNYLSLTAQMLNLYENNPAGKKAVLDALVRRFPMMSEVSILDTDGEATVMSASNRVELPSDLTNESYTPFFKAAIDDQAYVGVDSFPIDGSAPVLRLAVPIEEYRGKVVGVLSATLSLDDLWDTIRNAHFGKSGFAYVADNNGYPFLPPHHIAGAVLEQSAAIKSTGWKLVVAQPQSEVMLPIQSFKADISRNTNLSLLQMHTVIKMAASDAGAKLLSNVGKLHKTAIDNLQNRTDDITSQLNEKTGKQSAIVQAQLQTEVRSQIRQGQIKTDREMVIAARESSDSLEHSIPTMTARALLASKRRLEFYAIVIFIVSCGTSCLIGLFLAGTMVRPIIQLSHGTRALAMGELDKRVDERAPAEIGDLAVAFNMMAASLQESRADLTDAEAQLVQSAKLASLGTLSAGVAHELNQPVAIVRGLSQQLMGDDALPLEVREDLKIIEGQTTRMMKIITHLRTFCRTGGFELNTIDVNQVVRDCFILIDAQLRSHGVSVDMSLNEEPVLIVGDANELEQVFINLITNARDAMDGMPDACLSIKSEIVNGEASIEFRDNGLGIPDKVAEHIFDPFFTTKDVGKGTGLGLSISHGLIQKHHGTISTRNDGGAVFTITLPLAAAESTAFHNNGTSALTAQAA
jgi:C4-dicarboxylate-specific signal transduction histidine kinase